MVRHDDAVETDLAGDLGVHRIENALDQEVALPAVAQPLRVFPIESFAGVRTRRGFRHDRDAPPRREVLLVRHAVLAKRLEPDVHQPFGMGDRVVCKPRVRADRMGKSRARVVLTVAADRHVGGQKERAKSRVPDAVGQAADLIAVRAHVTLKPTVRIRFRNLFQGDQRAAAENETDILRQGRTGHLRVRAVGRKSRRAHRRDAERRIVGVAEHRHRRAALGNAVQHARLQPDLAERIEVAGPRLVALDAARNEFIQHTGQVWLGGRFQVLEAQHVFHSPRRGDRRKRRRLGHFVPEHSGLVD